MNTLKVGIMSPGEFQKRTLDIAAGRSRLEKGKPKIWFRSMESLESAVEMQGKLKRNSRRVLLTEDVNKESSV